MVASCFKILLVILLSTAQEGRIKRIRFKGNSYFWNSRLKNSIQIQRKDIYSESEAITDSRDIERLYRNSGFSQVSVRHEYEVEKGKLVFYISEGERLKVRLIRLIGVSRGDSAAVLRKIPLKRKDPLTWLELAETERITKRFYLERGYPYVVVDIDTASQGRDVEVSIKVAPGTRAWISGIQFRGYPAKPQKHWINPDFLKSTVRLKGGELYSVKRLDRAASQLYATYLFRDVDLDFSRTNPGRADSLDIVFTLEPDKQHAVLLGGGIQTGLSQFVPDRLLLSVGWEHLNLFHRGVTLSSEVVFNPKFNGDYEMELELRNRYPNFLPWGLALTVSPYWKNSLEKDSLMGNITGNILGGEVGLEKDFTDELRVGLSAKNKYPFYRANGLPFSPLDEGGITNFMRFSLIFDNRDDFFNPRRGIFIYPFADWAGRPLGGEQNFVRISTEFRNYLELPLESVLAWRLLGGVMTPHSSFDYTHISSSEKFTLGGSGTIRALPDKALGPDSVISTYETRTDTVTGIVDTFPVYDRYGTLMLLYNFEIRTPYFIKDLIGFAVFIDVGVCTRDFSSTPVENIEWAWGPGIGVRIKTPIGPIRLDYAKNALTPYSLDPLDIGRLEVGFLQAF